MNVAKTFDTNLKDLFAEYTADLAAMLGLDEPVRLLGTNLVANVDTDMVLGIGEPLRGVLDLNFQVCWDRETLLRVFTYNLLLYREHGVPVHSVVILLRSRDNDLRLEQGVQYAIWPDRGSMRFVPEVVRIWEKPVEELLTGGLGLLALAPLGQLASGVTREQALPEIIRRIHDRLAAEATPERADQLWNWMYELTGLHLTEEQVSPHFRRYEVIRQSLTWQATMERGEVRALQRTLLRLGTTKFGPPDESTRALLTNQTDLERLDRMIDSVSVVTTWQEVLATP